jgi:hypothetical protein
MKAGMPSVVELRENSARMIHAIYGEEKQGADSSKKRPLKAERRDEPAGVAAGNGQDRRRMDEEFEEF